MAMKKNNPGCNCCNCTNCNQGALFANFSTISGSVSGQPNPMETRSVINSCLLGREWSGYCTEDTIANLSYSNYPGIDMGSGFVLTQTLQLFRKCNGTSDTGTGILTDNVSMYLYVTQACTSGAIRYSVDATLAYNFQAPSSSVPWASSGTPPDTSGTWTLQTDVFSDQAYQYFWMNNPSPGSVQTSLYVNDSQAQRAGYGGGISYGVQARIALTNLTAISDIPLTYALNPLYNLLSITGAITLS